jgi:D-alanyl-lipoteichoic acid acyltransferase DltB (MBOAT superfamily)
LLFNSFVFLFAFTPIVLLGWWLLRRPSWRLAFLTLASYFFLGWWAWWFVPIMIVSTTADYVGGRLIARAAGGRRRKSILAAAIAVNLAILGYFKYRGFFLDSLDGIAAAVGAGRPFPALSVILPIGISFYTFNAMSYAIDVYRGVVQPARSLLHYTAFVSMFPHLVAGPIVRYADIDHQIENLEPRLTAPLAASGLYFFACGLAKKLLIADLLAPHVNALFGAPDHLGLLSAWTAALAYSLQLYFDFSGYSDMAVGLALLLGFRFPQNFDSPYKSINIADFWRRWHMSLSFWMRDYLFIPLGGSRGSRLMTLRNLMATMFLGGLWHGAGWTFVVWGLLHGCYLGGHALFKQARLTPPGAWLNRLITFVAVVAAWVVFRAPNLSVAGRVLGAMVGLQGMDSLARLRSQVGIGLAAAIIALLVFVNWAPNTWEITLRPRRRYAVVLGLLLAAAILTITKPSPFLYFQF